MVNGWKNRVYQLRNRWSRSPTIHRKGTAKGGASYREVNGLALKSFHTGKLRSEQRRQPPIEG